MIPSDLRNEIDTYIYENQLKDYHLLFQSLRTHKELSRQQAYRIIHHAAKELGLLHIGLTTYVKLLHIMLINRVFLLRLFKNI